MARAHAAAIPNRRPSLLQFWCKGCRIQSQSNTGGARDSGLRGSIRTSTLLPDADNAAVGSHPYDFLQEAPQKGVSCFLLWLILLF